MEVDKIAINDNFSSENKKNTPQAGSVNDRDAHTFRKQLSDKNKSDSIMENLFEDSEEFVQDLGSLFRKLKLSDEKEQSQNQQDSSTSNNEESSSSKEDGFPNKSFIKDSIKEDVLPNRSSVKDFTKEEALSNKSFTKDSVKEDILSNRSSVKDFTKEEALSNKSFIKDSVKEDILSNRSSVKDFTKEEALLNKSFIKDSVKEDILSNKSSVKDFTKEEALSNKSFIEDSVKNDIPISNTFVEGGLDTVELSPIIGIATTTNAQNTDFSTNIESKSTLSTVQMPSISQQIKDQVIDRILVSTASLNANQSVKVVFSPTVLAETEVNIQKLGQGLQVQFVSSDVKSIAFIQSNQLDLQGYLQSNLKQFEEVQVSLKEMEGDLDQPKDGRSRNRNEYQSLEDEEDEQ